MRLVSKIDSTQCILYLDKSFYHDKIHKPFFLSSKVGLFYPYSIHGNSFPILPPRTDPRFPPWKKNLSTSPCFSQDWGPSIDKNWKRKRTEVPPSSCVEQARKRWIHIQASRTNSNTIGQIFAQRKYIFCEMGISR